MSKKKLSIFQFTTVSYICLFILVITVILVNQYIASKKIDLLSHEKKEYNSLIFSKNLKQLYEKEDLPKGSYIIILDQNNKIIDQYKSPYPVGYHYDLNSYFDLVFDNNRVVAIEDYSSDGVKTTIVIYNTRFLEKKEDINKAAFQISLNMVVISIVIIAILMFLALRVNNRVLAKPFSKMVAAIVKIGNGDYNTKININNTKEMSILSNSVNDMSSKIKKEIQRRVNIEQDKQQMLMNISHDFKTPLSNIIGYSEQLKTYINDDQQNYLNVVIANSYKLNDMLESLQEIAQLDSKSQLQLEQVDINEFLRDIIIKNIPELELKDVQYNIDISEQKYLVEIDKAKFARVVDNIINNSLKYAGDDIILSVNTEQTDDEVIILIKDNGVGIPSKEINNVIKPFTRIDSSRSSSIKGFGLGLAFVSDVVKLHNGQLKINSSPNKGFEIIITLPK